MADLGLGLYFGNQNLEGLLAQRKAEALKAQAAAEKIRQFNVEQQLKNRQLDITDAQRRDIAALNNQTRADALRQTGEVRLDTQAMGILQGNTPPTPDVGSVMGGRIQSMNPGAIRTTAAVQPPETQAVNALGPGGALSGGDLQGPQQAASFTANPAGYGLPEGGALWQQKRQGEQAAADRSAATQEEISARAAEAEAGRTQRASEHNDVIRAIAAGKGGGADAGRLDKSYQFNSSQLEKVRQPIAQQQDRLSRIAVSLQQGTPQADALIAPELLTAMAGGQGSGLRMNEAEISRIVGGRSAWENLKANIQHWSADPRSANSITPDQRAQIQQLVTAMQQKVGHSLSVLDDAAAKLIDATDVVSHRKVINDARRQLQEIENQTQQSAIGAAPGGRTVVKQQRNTATGQIRTIYSDGTIEVK